MVCDFFHPRLGGVEMHLWSLSQSLLALGHDVIIITHSYKKGNNTGVRYLVGGCKVYYMPIAIMIDDDIWPTFCGCTFSLVRWICIREQIDLLHVHQATSVLANEALVYANEINNIPTVYTDHSLFGINTDIASILLNRILSITTSTCSAILCVSHACRDNFLLRTHMDPSLVHVIPNAISASKYQPDPSKRPHHSDRICVVVLSRLVYRKGVDLLVGLIPIICQRFENVDIIIGGDGPKRLQLEEMMEYYSYLKNRITLMGSIPHHQVSNLYQKGHIFLNCSLTESFCMAILEAASCGLYVVSTNVGGIPEVLPSHLVTLAQPTVPDLVDKLSQTIKNYPTFPHSTNPQQIHNQVKSLYSWKTVAQNTERIYSHVLQKHKHNRLTFLQRLQRYASVAPDDTVYSMTFKTMICFLYTFFHLYAQWIQRNWQPEYLIDIPFRKENETNQQKDDAKKL